MPVKGLYTGAMGMMVQMKNQEVIANNLANVQTPGYKKEITTFKPFQKIYERRINDDGVFVTPHGTIDKRPYVGKVGTGVIVDETYTDNTAGPLRKTDNPFDVAIHGEGYFCVSPKSQGAPSPGVKGLELGEGNTAVSTESGKKEVYTRCGTFTLDAENFLVTLQGDYVLGEDSRPIQIDKRDFSLLEDGRILTNSTDQATGWASPIESGKIKIVDFDYRPGLQKVGTNYLVPSSASGQPKVREEGFQIMQGHLEGSNVNIVDEMVRMIDVMRIYEANAKSISTADQTMGMIIPIGGQ
ncbi:flagellar hook-basal body protein [bacterium]|nr:flagellar hook-basal body protein [bacterium]